MTYGRDCAGGATSRIAGFTLSLCPLIKATGNLSSVAVDEALRMVDVDVQTPERLDKPEFLTTRQKSQHSGHCKGELFAPKLCHSRVSH